jgi:hypothetical protein
MPQIGDIGTVIDYDAGESIVDATVLKLKYKRPDGTIGEWIATLYGTTKARYTTLTTGDLPSAGAYDVQLYIEAPTWKGHGTIKGMTVRTNIGT